MNQEIQSEVAKLKQRKSDTPPAIEVRNLTKCYGDFKALDDLTFTVPAGVICGFVGPNGSGKTTTMRILSTLLKSNEGIAKVFDLDTHNLIDIKEVRHNIGYMPDYFGLYTDMTSSEYLEFFSAAYRIPAKKRHSLIDDILTIIGLSDKKDTLIAGLSRGMQQRLSLGRCLVHSPKLLLLDEPASGLDPRARIELMELLRELKNMGKTILISSHILSELHNLVDMVVIIESGKLIYSGTLENASKQLRQGQHFIELTIESDIDEAMASFKGLDEILDIRNQGPVIYIEHSDNLSSADIIAFCYEKNIRLEEAKRSEARLEEIFMTLTQNK
ncbi:MAG: ABC transporter ATP-binding protein [Lentisphaeria bacterium]|nr:ABC transporter ATP-binding protein [Lentisphaeria bacterium]NQZ70026.1 ABC transporter ATP-binding protein [Lentisphaeria bacterium]